MTQELKDYIDKEILRSKAEMILWVKGKVQTVKNDPLGKLNLVGQDLANHKRALGEQMYVDITSGRIEKFGFDHCYNQLHSEASE